MKHVVDRARGYELLCLTQQRAGNLKTRKYLPPSLANIPSPRGTITTIELTALGIANVCANQRATPEIVARVVAKNTSKAMNLMWKLGPKEPCCLVANTKTGVSDMDRGDNALHLLGAAVENDRDNGSQLSLMVVGVHELLGGVRQAIEETQRAMGNTIPFPLTPVTVDELEAAAATLKRGLKLAAEKTARLRAKRSKRA